MDIKILIALLPVVFMLHDFEEIIMFKPWLDKNRQEIKTRFPRLDQILRRSHDQLSTSAFAVAVLHEFALIAAITTFSMYFDSYHWWFGAFAAFSLHLIVHIAQWLVFGRYVPFIVTSILALPYCFYTLMQFLHFTEMTNGQLALWAGIGILLTAVSFYPAFFLAAKFEEWIKTGYTAQ